VFDDRVIYELINGKMILVNTPLRAAEGRHFVIRCASDDWSGFRTLAECEVQLDELEGMALKYRRGDGYYTVVER
jgi:hypothetical protein